MSGFDPGRDVLQLPQSAFPDVAHVLDATSALAAGATIHLTGSDSITLAGVDPAALNSQNIRLV